MIIEKYLWQGLTRLLAVYDGNSNLIMRFEYVDATMPVSMTKGGNTYYLTCDQVGSLKIVADASGNVIKRIDYDSFGNIINDTNPSFTAPFGFAGGLYDPDTGLVRFGFRDYDADTGRWTAKDPIFFGGGEIDIYTYVQNNPVNEIDPLGLWSIKGSFYWGYGGSFTLGKKDGKWFIRAGAGVGAGGGIKFYPTGGFPVKSKCEAGFIGASGSIGAALGPLSGEIKGEAGLGITKGPDGRPQLEYIEQGGLEGSLKGTTGLGLSLGGSVNLVDVGVAW